MPYSRFIYSGLLVFVFVFSKQVLACETPNPSQLRSFFNGQNHWIEVESRDLSQIVASKTIEFWVDFNDLFSSKVFKGDENMGQFDSVCLTKKNDVLKGKAQGFDVLVSKKRNSIQVKILFFKFHFRPFRSVIQK